ncbi:MAG: ADP-ribosyltransferase [Actinomycetota bacterium]|nr:ADP-ribosyltransferase [Actinomycetota bacterium]
MPAEQPLSPALGRVLLPAGTRCGAPDLIEYMGELEILLPRRQTLLIIDATPPSRERPRWTVDFEAR